MQMSIVGTPSTGMVHTPQATNAGIVWFLGPCHFLHYVIPYLVAPLLGIEWIYGLLMALMQILSLEVRLN